MWPFSRAHCFPKENLASISKEPGENGSRGGHWQTLKQKGELSRKEKKNGRMH